MREDRAAHIAALARQLRRDSRTRTRLFPARSHSTADLLLRQMELNQRGYAWSKSKEAETKTNEPQPILLAGEQEEHDREVERQEHVATEVASAFGITI